MALCTINVLSSFQSKGIGSIDKPAIGLDSFPEKGTFKGTEAELVTLLDGSLAYGTPHGSFANMVIQDQKPVRLKTDLWEITLLYKGLISNKPAARKGRAYPNKHSGEFGAPGQPTTPMPTEVSEPAVSLTFTYVSLTTPATEETGTAQTPPDPVTTPPYIWASLADPIYNYPNGWVLENRDFEDLVSSDITIVTDEYVYYHPLKPGGGS